MQKQWVSLCGVVVLSLPALAQAPQSYTITTVAGNGVSGYTGNGAQAAGSQFASPFGAVFSGGSLYITDQGNNRVRKIGADGSLSSAVYCSWNY